MPSLTPILRIRTLSKTCQRGVLGHECTRTILRDLNLDLFATERLAIVAPKGSGKTTLLYCLAGFLEPSSGTIQWQLGRDGDPRDSAHPTIAYLPERSPYYGFLSVTETLEYYVPDRSAPASSFRSRIADALETVGLTVARDARVRDLSPHALQRLRIAQALVGAPQIILLDELLSTLDAGAIAHTRSILRRVTQQGVTIVMTTHSREMAAQLATRTVVLTAPSQRAGAVLRPHPMMSRLSPPLS